MNLQRIEMYEDTADEFKEFNRRQSELDLSNNL